MFDGIGHFIKDAVDTVGKIPKAVGDAAGAVGHAVESVVDDIKHVPVLGQAFDLAFTRVLPAGIALDILRTAEQIAGGRPINQAILDAAKTRVLQTQNLGDTSIRKEGYANVYDATRQIVAGKPVKGVALELLKKETAEIKKVGPYAQSVVSLVPGVGTGTAAALAAGIAISDGAPLDQVALAAVKGAIPGGPLVQAAFSAAQAAAEGQSVDQIAISALPVSPQVKQAITFTLEVAKDVAAGKRVDDAVLKRADQVFAIVSPEIQKALSVGLAIGVAKAMQSDIARQLTPGAMNAIREIGQTLSHFDAVVAAARNVSASPEYQSGFDTAIGMLNARSASQKLLETMRGKLSDEAKKGFDAAAALMIGRLRISDANRKLYIRKPTPPAVSANTVRQVVAQNRALVVAPPKAVRRLGKKAPDPAALQTNPTASQKAGYLIATGLHSASTKQKETIVGILAQDPQAREGVAQAIRDRAKENEKNKSWIEKLFDWLFG